MSEEIKKIGEVQLGKTISNPFSRDGIVSLYVSMVQITVRGNIQWRNYGIVEFQKGNTTGKQRFDGDSFDDVVKKIRDFIDNEL